MKKITIIRHAESKFNAGEIKSEDELLNCKITEFGKKQATSLCHSFDTLILSPLKRAIETYVHSNIKTREIIVCDLFREQKEDSSLNYLENEIIQPETLDDVRKRAQQAIQFIKSHNSGNIGIISHGYFMWYFLEQCGQPPIPTYNCQSITFELLF